MRRFGPTHRTAPKNNGGRDIGDTTSAIIIDPYLLSPTSASPAVVIAAESAVVAVKAAAVEGGGYDLASRRRCGRGGQQSHYFNVRPADQFDAMIDIDNTCALEPLELTSEWTAGELHETYPMGLKRWSCGACSCHRLRPVWRLCCGADHFDASTSSLAQSAAAYPLGHEPTHTPERWPATSSANSGTHSLRRPTR
ncbi:MAG: hypothetical protein QOC76_138 [Mycobacterium sp.]|nr:hypothetical protein [Mycobacterium sp.]